MIWLSTSKIIVKKEEWREEYNLELERNRKKKKFQKKKHTSTSV